MLVLPIKKKWFDMIASGEKKEEYREIKPYYDEKFMKIFGLNYLNKRVELVFRNGYSHNSPSIKCLCILNKGYGKKEWGAEDGKEYYILSILKIIEIKNSHIRRKDNSKYFNSKYFNSHYEYCNAIKQVTNAPIQEINKKIEIRIDIEDVLKEADKNSKKEYYNL